MKFYLDKFENIKIKIFWYSHENEELKSLLLKIDPHWTRVVVIWFFAFFSFSLFSFDLFTFASFQPVQSGFCMKVRRKEREYAQRSMDIRGKKNKTPSQSILQRLISQINRRELHHKIDPFVSHFSIYKILISSPK
jgi:hypothetical protein